MTKFGLLITMFLVAISAFSQNFATKHIIKRGETFASIATQYGITEEEIIAAIPHIKGCFVGIKINIPMKDSSNTNNDTKANNVYEQWKNCPEKNRDLKNKLLIEAADSGHSEAQYYLAEAYNYGKTKGIKQDKTRAIEYYQKAAGSGNANAAILLSDEYRRRNKNSLNLHKDDIKSIYYLQKAAATGNSNALFGLGARYLEGIGVPRDSVKAAQYIEQSIANNKYSTPYYLSKLKEIKKHIKGSPSDLYKRGGNYLNSEKEELSALMFSLASEKGHKEATYNMGVMFEKGIGVQQDYEEAKSFYSKASNLGDKDASIALRNLNNKIEENKRKLTMQSRQEKQATKAQQPQGQKELSFLDNLGIIFDAIGKFADTLDKSLNGQDKNSYDYSESNHDSSDGNSRELQQMKNRLKEINWQLRQINAEEQNEIDQENSKGSNPGSLTYDYYGYLERMKSRQSRYDGRKAPLYQEKSMLEEKIAKMEGTYDILLRERQMRREQNMRYIERERDKRAAKEANSKLREERRKVENAVKQMEELSKQL